MPCYHSGMRPIACLLRPVLAALGLPALLLLLAAAVSPTLRAEAPQATLYAVELIVFRESAIGRAEDWNAAPTPRGFGSASTGGGTPQVLRVLPPDVYRLASVEKTLRGSGAWRPIAHAAWIQTAANWGTHIGLALPGLGVNAPGLSGLVYLERGTYLHLGLELTLQAADGAYTIDEMRSVRYNERQYFDHPAFGVIALVSPVPGPAAGR